MEGKAMPAHPDPLLPSSIEIILSLGEWFVRVTDHGASTIHTFERQSFAMAFAEEQCARLNLDGIVITDADESNLPTASE
jgi:hypothetical protein